MATAELVSIYAMYVIGGVESNHKWTSVNFNDPITIGMMQWYGTRAARLLNRVKTETPTDWAYLVANASSLTDDINTHDAGDDWWTERYLTRAEGNALIHIMQGDANHAIQQSQWNADATRYISTLGGWGLSLSHPRELIFAMCMYHQSPKRAGEVVRSAGGTATLDRLFTTCRNNSVLSRYKTRYTTAYNTLKAWNESNNPPDFGQVENPRADDTGGDSPQDDVVPSKLKHILQRGNDLILFGKDDFINGVIFHAVGTDKWIVARKPDETPIDDGDSTDPENPTDDEPTKQQKLVDKMVGYAPDTFKYSQGGGRLSPTTSGYTDCSALCWYVYKKVTGKAIGTWTGAQRLKGTKIYSGTTSGLNESDMKKGDLVFYNWDGSTASGIDHVEMYIGDGKVCGHGGPGKGPTIKSSIGRGASYIMVRRYV